MLLSSGYHDAALDLPPNTFSGFLIKPYRLATLYELVAQALDVEGASPLC